MASAKRARRCALPTSPLCSPSHSAQEPTRRFLNRPGDLLERQPCVAPQLLEGLEAREHRERRERSAVVDLEAAKQATKLALTVAPLACDQVARRGIQCRGSVELDENLLLARPEVHDLCDEVIDVVRLAHSDQCGVRVERLAHRVDEAEPRAEVL